LGTEAELPATPGEGDQPGFETPVSTEAGSLPTAVRRARVLETVRREQFASVADLSVTYGVSEVTIRNDLAVLAEQGRLRRVRGGAVHRTTTNSETPYEEAQATQVAAKIAIATAAAAIVESGQTVLIDAGTTTAATAGALCARHDLHDVTVFTNGLPVALELEPAIPQIAVMVTGGTLRRLQHSLVNPFGTTILEQVHGHVAILECQGIDPLAGVTHVHVGEAEIKRLMMRASRFRVLVADGSKLGQVSLVHLYPISELDLLITDTTADPEIVEALREQGLEVRIVG
jgi:DeoR family transcriptional regulator of aga operon